MVRESDKRIQFGKKQETETHGSLNGTKADKTHHASLIEVLLDKS